MRWGLLKDNKCPKCLGDLVKTIAAGQTDRITCKCGFSIGQAQYQRIVADRIITELAIKESQEKSYDEDED